MIEYLVQHPVVILYLAAAWFVAAVISAMPPLKQDAGFFTTWAYNVAQIVGASLDKVGHAAQQSTAFRQVEETLKTSDLNGIQKLENSKITTQTAEPTQGVTQ